jgi:hypothetical protein
LHRHCWEQLAPLGHQRQPGRGTTVGRQRTHVEAIEHDAAGSDRVHARQCSKQRRFARTVGADERQRLALLDFQADALHGRQQTVSGLQAFDLQRPPPR